MIPDQSGLIANLMTVQDNLIAENEHLRALIVAADGAIGNQEGVGVGYYFALDGQAEFEQPWDAVVASRPRESKK